jgi:putative hydrolase of the HAD superfamily
LSKDRSVSSFIVFDIGQVLVRFDRDRSIKYFSSYTSGFSEKNTNFPERIVRNYERGCLSDTEFYQEIRDALSLTCSCDEFFYGWNRMFIGPVKGIEELLKAISQKYTLFALSNTCSSHIQYLTGKYHFFVFFHHLITSYETGFLKPDIRIYKKAEQRYFFGQKPVLYIDDISENVLAAQRLGWSAYKFEDTEKLKIFLKERSIL